MVGRDEEKKDDENFEDEHQNKILKEIYGRKIKQTVKWYFEQPVELIEKFNIGVIASNPN